MADRWLPIPDWISASPQGAGLAVGSLEGTGQLDLVVLAVDHPDGQNRASYRVGRKLNGSGRVTGDWTPWYDVPGWFSSHNQGAAIALADLDADGHLELVVLMVDNPIGPNRGVFRVGRKLDALGQVTGGWSEWADVPDWSSWANQGAAITLAEPDADGRRDLVVLAIYDPIGRNRGVYRVGRKLGADGSLHGDWTDWNDVPDWFSSENQGAGVALTALAPGGPRALVVFQVDAPATQNQAFFRIGQNFGSDGKVADSSWTPWRGIPDWSSQENQGAAIVVADLAGNGSHDLLVLRVDRDFGESAASYQVLPLDPDPKREGSWEPLPYDSQVLPVHAAVLHTGRVLFAAGSGNSGVRFNDPRFGDTTQQFWCSVVWNPDGQAPAAERFFHPDTLRNEQGKVVDFFCGGETFLPDGRVLAAGGTLTYDVDAHGHPFLFLLRFRGRTDALAFDPATNQWERMADMADGRWYPTLITLGDGRVLAAAGLGKSGFPNRSLEVFTPDGGVGGWTELPLPSEAEFTRLPLYAHLFLMAEGRVFFSGGRMDDASVSQSPCLIDIRRDPIQVRPIAGLEAVSSRNQSASVLLPPAQDQRVMIMGGAPHAGEQNATDRVDIVDLKVLGDPLPTYGEAAPLLLPRVHANAVLLPDRTVFVSGGALQREGGTAHKTTARLQSEIYDPERDEWILGATAQVARMYHSVALLLPDGRVVAAGGNPEKGRQVEWKPPDENEELRLEIYSPPYLFRKTSRPAIGEVKTGWQYGETLAIPTEQASEIKWASLIRSGATTHSFNTSQRLVDLPIQSRTGGSLTVTVTPDPNTAPPGWYMLFITDNDRVPSVARWIRLDRGPRSGQTLVQEEKMPGRDTQTSPFGGVSGVPRKGALKGAQPTAGPAGPGRFPGFVFHGGPVIKAPDVHSSFWGDWSDAPHQARAGRLNLFLRDLVTSRFMNVLSQYGVGTGTFSGSSQVPVVPAKLTDARIQEIIQAQIDAGNIPESSKPANLALILFLAEGIGVQDTDLVMCEPASDNAFGYHKFFTTSAGNPCYYAVIPALEDACLGNTCPDDGACSLHLAQTQEQRQTQVSSHEFAEMVRDPELSAWFHPDENVGENGDICNGESAQLIVGGNTWTVQRTYSKTDDMRTNGTTFCLADAPAPIPALPRRLSGTRPGGSVAAGGATVREAPPLDPLQCGIQDASRPDVGDHSRQPEPVLAMDQIQGNIVAGFSKDHQILLFFHIHHPEPFKEWMKTQIPFIATAAEVLAFNRLFKFTRSRRGREGAVKATRVNVAFTYTGLQKLTRDLAFHDEPFKDGLATRSPKLGDPVSGLGSPETWVVGGPKTPEVHGLFIIAADERSDMLGEVARIETMLADFRSSKGKPAGVEIMFADEGATLPPPLTGHEHFGFLDGVSQPGLRGRISDDPTDVLTPRRNPNKRDQPPEPGPGVNKGLPAQGLPGQDLLWPGEFVFGYPRQNPTADENWDGPNPAPGETAQAGPGWTEHGSFLVFRRLRQHVGVFHQFLKGTAKAQAVQDPAQSSAARLVGAKLVGRWPSGAPVERTTGDDLPNLADDDCANNNFEFQGATEPIPPIPTGQPGASAFNCVDNTFPRSDPPDADGLRCPFTGHIRKAYPRDEVSVDKKTEAGECGEARKLLNESDTQTHRLLRRGIPFGPVSRSTPEVPFEDGEDRGLHFLAYQTSIDRQFEFVTRCWVNNPDFKEPFGAAGTDANLRGGHDPIIGQGEGAKRTREFTLTIPDPAAPQDPTKTKRVRVTTDLEWVIPSGGGYFFAPSIKALEDTLT